MSTVRRKAELLRDENERLARAAKRDALNLDLTEEQRRDASEQAEVYWQMSRFWADTVTNAADVYPRKFTGKNVGTQTATAKRAAFLRQLSDRFDTVIYEALAVQAKTEEEAHALWPKKREDALENAVLNFLKKHKPLKN